MERILHSDWLPERILPPLGIFLIGPARKSSLLAPLSFLRDRTAYEQVFSCLQIKTVDWPFEEGGNGANERSILDYLAQNKFDMVINLPLRTSGSRRASSYLTHGYRTRRMAIDYSIPLITDIKCAKLFIEVITVVEFLLFSVF